MPQVVMLDALSHDFATTVGGGAERQFPPDTDPNWFMLGFTAIPLRDVGATSASVIVMWAKPKAKDTDHG